MDKITIDELNQNHRELLAKIVEEVSYCSGGLIGVGTQNNANKVNFLGSGTLVNIKELFGILTAKHVVNELYSGYKQLGVTLSKELHKSVINLDELILYKIGEEYTIQIGKESTKIPDLIFMVPIKETDITLLQNSKMFYNLAERKEDVLKNTNDPMFIDQLKCICGAPDEFTTTEIDLQRLGEIKVFQFNGLFTGIQRVWDEKGYDLYQTGVDYGNSPGLPSTFGGVSGGGLWNVCLSKQQDNSLASGTPILCGVAFFETEREGDKRGIICHGVNSIFEKLYEVVLNKTPASI